MNSSERELASPSKELCKECRKYVMTAEDKLSYAKACELLNHHLEDHPLACACPSKEPPAIPGKAEETKSCSDKCGSEALFVPPCLYGLFRKEIEVGFANKGVDDSIGLMFISCLAQDDCKTTSLDLRNNELTAKFGDLFLQFMKGNESINKVMLGNFQIVRVGGNKVSKDVIERIEKIARRNSAEHISDLSECSSSVTYKLLSKMQNKYYTAVENHSLKAEIKTLWAHAFAGRITIRKADIERVARCLDAKASSRLMKSVIESVYGYSDKDLFLSTCNNSIIEVISIRHNVGIKYYANMHDKYYPVLVNRKIYMLIKNSKELYIAHLPDCVRTKNCKVTKGASRHLPQSFVSAFPIGVSHIASIGYNNTGTFLSFQLYNISSNSWTTLPSVPISGHLHFAAWPFAERAACVVTEDYRLFSIDLLDLESGWQTHALKIFDSEYAYRYKPNVSAVQLTPCSSLVVIDRWNENSPFFCDIIMCVLDHKKGTAKVKLKLWDSSDEPRAGPLRLVQGKYIYGKRRASRFNISQKKLECSRELCIQPNYTIFY